MAWPIRCFVALFVRHTVVFVNYYATLFGSSKRSVQKFVNRQNTSLIVQQCAIIDVT